MKRNRRQVNPQDLDRLASLAKNYAVHMMRTTGSVPPTAIADTEQGFVFCMPTGLTNDAAKDRFANATRLFAIAQTARALVIIVEAWVTTPDPSDHMAAKRPPSQDPNRREMVMLMLEDHTRKATSLLPILRDESGAFAEFGDPGPLHFGGSEGRFVGLMPQNKPSVRESAQAKAALVSLGMSIINRGFDPTMN